MVQRKKKEEEDEALDMTSVRGCGTRDQKARQESLQQHLWQRGAGVKAMVYAMRHARGEDWFLSGGRQSPCP